MSDTAQLIFGICGLVGGLSGLIGAAVVWRGQHR